MCVVLYYANSTIYKKERNANFFYENTKRKKSDAISFMIDNV